MKWIVGIDEVGRGPLAGPVCIGMCVAPADKRSLVWKVINGARDSKKLSVVERNYWYRNAKYLRLCSEMTFYTAMVSNTYIDKRGMSEALRTAIKIAFRKAKLKPSDCKVLLDGSLYAPSEFSDQETIIKGDDKEPIISLASIIAKVERDSFMQNISVKYPQYGFEINKGYGTKTHIKALKDNGPSALHRLSFLGNILHKD